MADIDINPFGEHESRPDEPTGENIPLPPVTPVGGSTWEPECEQETSFGRKSHRTKLKKDYVRHLYQKISEKYEVSEAFHFDYFKLRDGELYYKGKSKPLTNRVGKLRSAGVIVEILGKNRLRDLGFDIPKGKLTAQQATLLNRAGEELHSESDIAKADDIEWQEITENASRSIENLNQQLGGDREDLPMRELLGLDKQLRRIRGSLKVEVAKKVQLEENIEKEHQKHEEFQEYLGVYGDAMGEDITK